LLLKTIKKKKISINTKENQELNLIDQIIDLSANFFIYVLENVLSNEKKKLDNNNSEIESENCKKVENVSNLILV
jgi:hypothetical protein